MKPSERIQEIANSHSHPNGGFCSLCHDASERFAAATLQYLDEEWEKQHIHSRTTCNDCYLEGKLSHE